MTILLRFIHRKQGKIERTCHVVEGYTDSSDISERVPHHIGVQYMQNHQADRTSLDLPSLHLDTETSEHFEVVVIDVATSLR